MRPRGGRRGAVVAPSLTEIRPCGSSSVPSRSRGAGPRARPDPSAERSRGARDAERHANVAVLFDHEMVVPCLLMDWIDVEDLVDEVRREPHRRPRSMQQQLWAAHAARPIASICCSPPRQRASGLLATLCERGNNISTLVAIARGMPRDRSRARRRRARGSPQPTLRGKMRRASGITRRCRAR